MDIAVIESDAAILAEVMGLLEKTGYGVRPINSGKEAVASLQKKPPAGILLRVEMADLNGFVICNKIKKDDALCNIPLVLMYGDTPVKTLKQHSQLKTHANFYIPLKSLSAKLALKMKELVGAPKNNSSPSKSPSSPAEPPKPLKAASLDDDLDVDAFLDDKLGVSGSGSSPEKEEIAEVEPMDAQSVEIAEMFEGSSAILDIEPAVVEIEETKKAPSDPAPTAKPAPAPKPKEEKSSFTEAEKLRLLDEIIKYKTEIREKENQIRKLEEKNLSLDVELQEAQTKIIGFETDLQSQEEKASAQEEKVKTLEDRVNSLEANIRELEESSNALKSEKANLEAELKDKDNRINDLEALIAKKDQEFREAETKIREAETKAQESEQEASDLFAQNSELNSEIETLKRSLEEATSQAAEAESISAHLKDQLHLETENSKTLREKLSKLNQILGALTNSTMNLQEELQNMKDEIGK